MVKKQDCGFVGVCYVSDTGAMMEGRFVFDPFRVTGRKGILVGVC